MPFIEINSHPISRQLALKALNERLNKPEAALNWPSLDDDGPASPTGPETLPAPVGTKSTGTGQAVPQASAMMFKDGPSSATSQSPQENV